MYIYIYLPTHTFIYLHTNIFTRVLDLVGDWQSGLTPRGASLFVYIHIHIHTYKATHRLIHTYILIHIYDFHSFDFVGDRESGLTPRGVSLFLCTCIPYTL